MNTATQPADHQPICSLAWETMSEAARRTVATAPVIPHVFKPTLFITKEATR